MPQKVEPMSCRIESGGNAARTATGLTVIEWHTSAIRSQSTVLLSIFRNSVSPSGHRLHLLLLLITLLTETSRDQQQLLLSLPGSAFKNQTIGLKVRRSMVLGIIHNFRPVIRRRCIESRLCAANSEARWQVCCFFNRALLSNV